MQLYTLHLDCISINMSLNTTLMQIQTYFYA